MSIEEIIKILTTDADVCEELGAHTVDIGVKQMLERKASAFREAIALLKINPDYKPNEPLTLEELRVTAEELALINELARKELTAEEVYTFSVRLCDNEIDREWERFPRETLEELAGMFVGKSGIFDHNWSAAGQNARIYKAQVVEEEGKTTGAGDPGCYLKGWAYMLRTEGNRELIAQIEGGIKKEVSMGCAVKREVCSICGGEMGKCRHVKGRTYNGKLCWGELTGAKDAYEWSFVAVPTMAREILASVP